MSAGPASESERGGGIGGVAPGRGRLEGRIAVIVGAGQAEGETVGNGRATAITFAREGASLVLVDRDPGSLAETAAMTGGDPVQVVADISADDAPANIVAAAVERFGRLDILHNNVGIGAGDGPPHHLGLLHDPVTGWVWGQAA
ncbi:MAG: SDR family NAD(P)-dependent oxidoreductase [Microthrixaceae bacterium]